MKIDLCTPNLWREIQSLHAVALLLNSMAMADRSAEGSSGSQISKKEENERLLYLWQRTSFMDSGKGVPKEMADSLRLRVAMLGSYHTKM